VQRGPSEEGLGVWGYPPDPKFPQSFQRRRGMQGVEKRLIDDLRKVLWLIRVNGLLLVWLFKALYQKKRGR
jgi:hypothetical protein